MKRIETLADLDALDLARSEQDRRALLAWARDALVKLEQYEVLEEELEDSIVFPIEDCGGDA